MISIIDGWEISVDDDYVNFLDSKINNVKNSIGLSNYDCGNIINDLDSYFVDKYNTCDHKLTLCHKCLGNRQVGKNWLYRSCIIFSTFILNWLIRVV